MHAAISVENISKRYQVNLNHSTSYRTLRESITNGIVSRWRRARGSEIVRGGAPGESGIHWALKDVSFDIQAGEVVGIIGRNGAGKSTLLKILSRITEPTSGRAMFWGRMGSLLEVGTGFHAELTGRENIYLNGSILGMSRREIDRRFDEIVAFSEIDKFLDTPVKRYSSGMYVRLAFAVAAHLEPEILLVDEVLAVGDAQFQKKCLGKMNQIANEGKTVVFVSHQMSAVQRLCSHCLFMEKGRVKSYGSKDEVIAQYLTVGAQRSEPGQWIDLADVERSGTQETKCKRMRFHCPDGRMAHHPFPDGPVEIEVEIQSDVPRSVTSAAVTFYDRYGTKLVNADTVALGQTVRLDRETTIRLRINELHLNPDTYTIGLWLANSTHVYDYIIQGPEIEVLDPPADLFGKRPSNDGIVTCDFSLVVHS